jgi:hypothetical protein
MDSPHPPAGTILIWELRGLGHDWSLYYMDELVSSLRSVSLTNGNCVGIFDNIPIRITYHYREPYDTAIITNSMSKEELVKIMGVSVLPSTIRFKGTNTYSLRFDGKKRDILFCNDLGKPIARTEYDFKHSKMGFLFTIIDWRDDEPSPWLIALISLYIGINHSS